jgi:hypothetical protein
MKFLKHSLISLLIAFGFTCAKAQPPPVYFPFTAVQGTYTSTTGLSVPYAIITPSNGLLTVVFDPSTPASLQSEAFAHLKKASSDSSTNAQPLQLLVLPGVISTAYTVYETRTAVPFVVANSTTLQTIPFTFPTTLQTGGHYRFEARLYLNAGSGGSKIDVGGTCNTSNFVAEYQSYTTTTLLYGGQLTSFLSGPGGSSTTGQTFIIIQGELDVTNGGTFVIQFAQNGSNATPSVVLAGSTLTVIQIP